MPRRLTIGVLGAGSIGCFVAARLLAADIADVVLVGRPRIRDEIAAHGLTASDFDSEPLHIEPSNVSVATKLSVLSDCDAVLVCVKSLHTEDVATELADVLRPDAVVVSFQNGVRNADTLRRHLRTQTVIASIVGFNVVSKGEGVFHRGMSGDLILEKHHRAEALVEALRAADLDVRSVNNLKPDQWTKLLVNLNNAVSALSGAPTRELLLSPGYRRIVSAIMAEALEVLRAAGIKPARLRGVPVGIMPKVLRLPTPMVRLVTRAQMRVDPEARSSMWEDLSRRRPTEVEFLNGEIVRLAETVGVAAPVNSRIVELVRKAEQANAGPPDIDAASLMERLGIN